MPHPQIKSEKKGKVSIHVRFTERTMHVKEALDLYVAEHQIQENGKKQLVSMNDAVIELLRIGLDKELSTLLRKPRATTHAVERGDLTG